MLTQISLPIITSTATIVLVVLQVILMGLVIRQRGAREVIIGDGGIDAMQQVIRVHANLIENAPIFLIALALCELMAGSTLGVAALAGVFVVARIAHAFGYSQSPGVTRGRLLGTMGTMLSLLGFALYLGFLVIGLL